MVCKNMMKFSAMAVGVQAAATATTPTSDARAAGVISVENLQQPAFRGAALPAPVVSATPKASVSMFGQTTVAAVPDLERIVEDLQRDMDMNYNCRNKDGEKNKNSQGEVSYAGKRSEVKDFQVRWEVDFEGYSPTEWTDPDVLGRDGKPAPVWADPVDFTSRDVRYKKEEYGADVELFENGRPKNPKGRTGMTGRGLLGRWGANPAVDPILTRYHPTTGKLQMVVIERKDTAEWAIPGGMIDAGDGASPTLVKEFTEEAMGCPFEEQSEKVVEAMSCEERAAYDAAKSAHEVAKAQVKKIFKESVVTEEVYYDYVDDSRNTDNAWMISKVVHFHLTEDNCEALNLKAGDDAANVKWLNVDLRSPQFNKLYASHKQFVLMAVQAAEELDYDSGKPVIRFTREEAEEEVRDWFMGSVHEDVRKQLGFGNSTCGALSLQPVCDEEVGSARKNRCNEKRKSKNSCCTSDSEICETDEETDCCVC